MSFRFFTLTLAFLLLTGTAPSAVAQFARSTEVIAAGGASTSGAPCTVQGTVGQPLAGRVPGGRRSVNQGFWFGSKTGELTVLASHSASVSADGTVDLGETGVDIVFSGTSGSGQVTVTKYDNPPADTTGIRESTVSDYLFVIEVEAGLRFGSSTELQLDTGALAGVNDPSTVAVYRRSSHCSRPFDSLSVSYDSGAGELVAQTGTFGEFVLASDDRSNPLPVELAGFEARLDGGSVLLQWRTASEQNNAGFEVQRQVGPKEKGSWTKVAFVESKAPGGTTSDSESTRDYRFTDREVPYEAETLRYRLEQVDTDGTTHVSKEVTVDLGTPEQVALRAPFPNPVREQATIRYELPQAGEMHLVVYDLLGRTVAVVANGREEAGRKQIRLQVDQLPSGTYFLHLRAGEKTRTERFTVVH